MADPTLKLVTPHQDLVKYTVRIAVPCGLAEHTEDKLCNVLELIDLAAVIKQSVEIKVRQNSVLSRFVLFVSVEE